MGIEGVTPGTSYTLVTPSDSSFAVDLARNLQLSGQVVPPDLLALAQKDPKWERVNRHGTGGGKGPGEWGRGGGVNRIGIGFGPDGGPKAMTSAMLAEHSDPYQNKIRTIGGTNNNDSERSQTEAAENYKDTFIAGNKYVEGRSMGRGKHLAQPSWTNSDSDQPNLASKGQVRLH